jgi:hypothetical protein
MEKGKTMLALPGLGMATAGVGVLFAGGPPTIGIALIFAGLVVFISAFVNSSVQAEISSGGCGGGCGAGCGGCGG